MQKLNLKNYLVTALVCFIAPAILFLLFYDRFFPAIGFIDPYIYVGYGFNYTDSSFLFSYYKISRLPWVLVQFVFRNVFDNLVGSYILFFSLFSLSGYLLLKIGEKIFDKFSAAIVAIAAINLYCYFSGGLDYNNIFSTVLFLGIVYFTISKWEKWQESNGFFIVLGIIYALAIHTNILIAIDVALIVCFYYIAAKYKQSQNPFENLGRKILLVITGIVVITVILCLINASVGRRAWFVKPLINAIINESSNNAIAYWQPFSAFLSNAYYLSGFAALTLFSLIVTAKISFDIYKKRSINYFVLASNLAFLIIILENFITYFLKITNLHFPYFAYTILIPFLLALTANIHYFCGAAFKDDKNKEYKLLILTLIWAVSCASGIFYFNLVKNNLFLNSTLYWLFPLLLLALLRNKKSLYFFLPILLILIASTQPNFEKTTLEFIGKTNFSNRIKCSSNRGLYLSYIEFNQYLNNYKKSKKSEPSNVFAWWNPEQKLMINPKCQNFDYNDSQKNFTNFMRSIITASGTVYPLDNPWLVNGTNTMEKLWSSQESNQYQKYFDDITQYPRFIILVSYDKNDAQKAIKKLNKDYNLNFELIETRRMINGPYILQYFILAEVGKDLL